MGNFKEYEQYDGLGLAELIRKKEEKPWFDKRPARKV